MNILRFSTFSLTAAIAVITLGYANFASAEKPDCPNDPSHPSCSGGGGDGGGSDGDATYSANFTGELSGGSAGDAWLGHGKGVGANVFSGLDDTFIDLEHFEIDVFGELDCFDSGGMNPYTYLPNQVSVNKAKKNTTEAWFWFTASAVGGAIDATYLLQTFGTFDDPPVDWPPSATTSMTMTRWVLKLENGQAQLEGAVCEGDSDVLDFGFEYSIEVCLGRDECQFPP